MMLTIAIAIWLAIGAASAPWWVSHAMKDPVYTTRERWVLGTLMALVGPFCTYMAALEAWWEVHTTAATGKSEDTASRPLPRTRGGYQGGDDGSVVPRPDGPGASVSMAPPSGR